MAAPRPAHAVTCIGVGERLELAFLSAARDGDVVAAPPADLGPLHELSVVPFGDLQLHDGDNAAHYVLEFAIEPTAEAQAYLDRVDRKSTQGFFCSGFPASPARPGVYGFSGWHNPEDATIQHPFLTLAADRETVTLDFLRGDEAWTVVFEVEDVGFQGCVCTASDSTGPAAPTLALFTLLVCWRRRSRRRRPRAR